MFPLSSNDKKELSETASRLSPPKTPEEEHSAVAALESMKLGRVKFEIEDHRFANGEPPMMLEWVKFTGIVTVPADFLVSEKLVSAKQSLRYVECPAMTDEIIENIRNPKRHYYFLPTKTVTPAEP